MATPSHEGLTFSKGLIRSLLYHALRLGARQSDAWDTVQDTLERALRKRPAGLTAKDALRWLCVVLRNVHLDRVRSAHFRSLGGNPDLIDQLPAPDPVELPLWRTTEPERVRRALRRLRADQREILLMQTRDQMSLREIGVALGVPTATAGTRAHRARERLRQVLLAAEGADEAGNLYRNQQLPWPESRPDGLRERRT